MQEIDGGWLFRFSYCPEFVPVLIEKRSISFDGISITMFSVVKCNVMAAIIPYIFHRINTSHLKPSRPVNIEFDILGKYIHHLFNYQNPYEL